jgi:hypothetical protein
MRLMEVGTKQQSMGHKEKANQLFTQAYDLYCLFWGLNMNLVDTKDIAWKPDNLEDVEKEVAQLTKGAQATPVKTEKKAVVEAVPATGVFGKLKAVVRKAVDCCIE